MSVPVTLSMTGNQHGPLKDFLFPGDGKEAVAILVCGRRDGDRRHRILVRDIHNIPYEACSVRTATQVTWSPELIEPILNRAEKEELSIIKVHSHPGGFPDFSHTDNAGDSILLPLIRGWVEADIPHCSAVMLPDGQMFGRFLQSNGKFEPITAINVVGDDLHFWYADAGSIEMPSFVGSHKQAFGEGTTEQMRRMSAAVIGFSGTGSPVVEQLMRLGFGEIIVVDDDRMLDRNVNRILNSTMADVEEERFKVDVAADTIKRADLGTRVISLPHNLWNPSVIREVAQCDVIFGCMDTVDGRFLLNTLATYYTIPYFDIGVRLDAVPKGFGQGLIREICGTVHYLQPGRSSLMSRGLFDMAKVAAAGLYRKDPTAYKNQLQAGYIAGVAEQRPAVISVNMFAASLAVNEFLARIHPYREDPNCIHGSVTFSLASMELISEPEDGTCELLSNSVGVGDREPLLELVELAERRAA